MFFKTSSTTLSTNRSQHFTNEVFYDVRKKAEHFSLNEKGRQKSRFVDDKSILTSFSKGTQYKRYLFQGWEKRSNKISPNIFCSIRYQSHKTQNVVKLHQKWLLFTKMSSSIPLIQTPVARLCIEKVTKFWEKY